MLHHTYIHAIAERGARYLVETGAVADTDPETLEHLLERAIVEEFGAAERLRDEARKLVSAHSAAAKAEGADVSDLLEKVVRKLAEDRGVVLR
ncbi:MAG TPA: DUF507 family protein [Deferrisomatales bacterium]|nr:DUF507 family protein [Deferrisomatales bacterium]